MTKRFFASLTRVTDLEVRPFEVTALPRDAWSKGDFVVAEVVGKPSAIYRVELSSGRRTPVLPGQELVGAFGKRAATHDCCGDWQAIGDDLALHQLTGAGLMGKATSISPWSHRPMELVYRGHAMRGDKLNIRDFVPTAEGPDFALPVILVTGTSMSAGKTLTARAIIFALKNAGLRVIAAKLTGAAGYKDALGYGDAGADHILDYVDAGLTDTVCPEGEFAEGMARLMSLAAAKGADVFVGEIGASPLEPYNGLTALSTLAPHLRLLALAASDAYAAKGFLETVPFRPDILTGPVANTEASVALAKTMTGLDVVDLSSAEDLQALAILLQRNLK